MAPAGWLTLVLLATGLGLSWSAYSQVMDLDAVPKAPGDYSGLQLLQRTGQVDEQSPPRISFSYNAAEGTANLSVCSQGDVAFILTGEHLPVEAQVHALRTTIALVRDEDPNGQQWAWLKLSHDVPSLWNLDSGCSAVITMPADGWLANRESFTVAFRAPSLGTCGWSYGGIKQFRLPGDGDGTWEANFAGSCTDYTTLDLGTTWTVTSAAADPIPAGAPGGPRYTRGPSTVYGPNVAVNIQDSSAVGAANSRRTRLGILLGIGLTLAIEGILGMLNAIADKEERRRLIRGGGTMKNSGADLRKRRP